MNAMRLLQRLRAAEDKFEKEVQHILEDATNDQTVAGEVLRRKYHKEPPKRAKKAKARRVGTKKGHSYNGTHWTQRPENAHKLAKLIKASTASRKAKRHGA